MTPKKEFCFRNDMADTYMNSQSLWQYAEDLYKFKADKIPAWRTGNRYKAPSLVK